MTKPRLSGYSVTYNCIDYSAPFSASIRSLLGFCDEVVVVDAGSTDGTIDVLKEIARADSRLRVVEDSVDFTHPRWGLHLICELKARARILCRGEYLWEMDTDEVVSAQQYPKIAQTVANMALSTNDALVLALPVAHFWGDSTNLRTDIAVWRARLTRNDARITHGVPSTARETDELGNYFPRLLGPPTIQDAISYTWLDLESKIPLTFPEGYNQSQDLRIHSLDEYLTALEDLPIVLNLGYLNLNRALHQCKSFLPGLYTSIFKDHNFDTSEWNPIFKKPWAVVSDEDIAEGALGLKELGPVQLISRALEIGVKGSAHHQLKIPQSVKDWHREFSDMSGSNYEDDQFISSKPSPDKQRFFASETIATEFSSMSGESTEIHDLQVEFPPHSTLHGGCDEAPIIHRTIPADVNSLLYLAHAALEEGQLAYGRKLLSFAENIAPKNPNVIMTRIDILLATGEILSALAYAKRGLWLFPTHNEFRDLYQQCLTAKK